MYLAVGTVALAGLFDESLFRQDWFANGGGQMLVARPSYLGSDHAFAFGTIALATGMFAFTATILRGRTGRAMAMARDNPLASEASGVNQVKYRLLAFTMSAIFAGTMGALFAYLLGAFTTASFSLLILSLTAFSTAAVGGIRSPLGAVIGAFLFVQATEVFRTSGSIDDWSTLLVGVGLIVVMASTPDGLVGLGQRLAARLRPGSESAFAEVTTDA